jgi:hypothetical protein
VKQLALFQAAQSRAWTHEPADEARAKEAARQVTVILRGILQQAGENRQFKAGLDIDLIADLLWQAYLSNYRLAVFDNYDRDQLNRRMERQINLVLNAGQV